MPQIFSQFSDVFTKKAKTDVYFWVFWVIHKPCFELQTMFLVISRKQHYKMMLQLRVVL